ncbi:hypothetical protein Trydic_g1950 [Trypoxylus dichotomus]
MEVLDLHGNQIQTVHGVSTLSELKVLNLAGNQLKTIGSKDFHGLSSLQELNLRRNHLRKLMGFSETPNLQKLFLSNNEVQALEDMNSIAKAVNIKELSIDNNPVFLGGDCISFLVSYLPNLTSLNSMQVTDIVRKGAMAWRRNKESTNSAFMELSSDVTLTGRREEVISNARTNWELIRCQTKCLTVTLNSTIAKVKRLEPDVDFILTSLLKPENKTTQCKPKNVSATKVPTLNNKKVYNRTTSQDTDTSQNTSSSNGGSTELFRLPPILVPIINKMEQKQDNGLLKDGKLSDSLSSIGPNIDSSVSSLNSIHTDSNSSESESIDGECSVGQPEECNATEMLADELNTTENQASQECSVENVKITNSENNSDSGSSLSINAATSNITTISLNSDSSIKSSLKSLRNVKSAANFQSVQAKVNSRASTAKVKKTSPISLGCREREQGGDYLIEICGRHLNIYGHGAVRFVDKLWNQNKANDVTTVNFNYTSFNSLATILNKIKIRFPNAEHFTFKETNIQYLGQLNALAELQGISSLCVEEEGNPITLKKWKNYAIYRLSHWGLKTINGQEVTEDDITQANRDYQSLSDLVLWSLPESLLQPLLTRLHIDLNRTVSEITARQWLSRADPALRSVVCKEALQWKKVLSPQEDTVLRQKAKQFCGTLIDETCYSIRKLRLLEREWPTILQEIVQNTLLDYSQLDIYMKEKINELL